MLYTHNQIKTQMSEKKYSFTQVFLATLIGAFAIPIGVFTYPFFGGLFAGICFLLIILYGDEK